MKANGPQGEDHKVTLIKYWMEKARESIEGAKSEYYSGRQTTAVRNLYYACFYALTAVLLKEGRSFKKHNVSRPLYTMT